MRKMTVDDKLGLDLFHTDEEYSHIKVDLTCTDMDEINKLLLACPFGLPGVRHMPRAFTWQDCPGVASPPERDRRFLPSGLILPPISFHLGHFKGDSPLAWLILI